MRRGEGAPPGILSVYGVIARGRGEYVVPCDRVTLVRVASDE